MQDKDLKTCLEKELQNVMSLYGNIELVSPLADRSDRLFVDMAMESDSQKVREITIPMPFEKEEYRQDFLSYRSKGVFGRYFVFDRIYKHIIVNAYSLSYGISRPQEHDQELFDNQ